MRFTSLLLLTCLLFFINNSFTQETKSERKQQKKLERKARDKYLNAGIGFAWMSAKDKATSPLLYSGLIGLGNLEYLVHSDKLIKTFDLAVGAGYLKTNKDTHYGLTRGYEIGIYFNFRFAHIYRVMQLANNKINWYLGPALDFSNYSRINYKYGNALYNYEYMTGVGLSTRFEFPFSYKSKDCKLLGMKLRRRDRDLRLSWQLYFPVFTSIYRPGYVTIINFADPETPLINPDNLKTGLFTYFHISSEVELYYKLHNGNMLKLTYLWEFHQYNPGYNKVQGAMNGLYFSFVFKLNNKNKAKAEKNELN
ncbi:MAG: hypothetical protein H8D45_22450 [Bacteroidetes bacterium]|nr:hypothetical protein [Bacteroidota bacterium]MBL7104155.1 hypothetical protein [Bacteroidales bacterium]